MRHDSGDCCPRTGSGRTAGRRTLRAVWSQRAVVDYGLARRATLTSLLGSGPITREDACDAHPYLLRAARHHGEASTSECPVCRDERLRLVHYVYGDELGAYEGRVKAPAELAEMAHEHGEFRVYVVEVCLGCAWNHLVQSFVLGTGAGSDVGRPVRRGAGRRERTTGPAPR